MRAQKLEAKLPTEQQNATIPTYDGDRPVMNGHPQQLSSMLPNRNTPSWPCMLPQPYCISPDGQVANVQTLQSNPSHMVLPPASHTAAYAKLAEQQRISEQLSVYATKEEPALANGRVKRMEERARVEQEPQQEADWARDKKETEHEVVRLRERIASLHEPIIFFPEYSLAPLSTVFSTPHPPRYVVNISESREHRHLREDFNPSTFELVRENPGYNLVISRSIA